VNAILIPIVLFGCVFSVAIVAILAKTFAQVVCHWRDVSLKIHMVDAGYTASEIERVMSARRGEINGTELDVPPVRKSLPIKKMA
jgi:hypothetical protein